MPNAEFDDGSYIGNNDPSSIVLSEYIARPPTETYPFAVLGQSLKATYSFVDEDSAQKEMTRSFIVRAILKITGNPTTDNTVMISRDAANSLMNRGNKYDSIVVLAKDPDQVDTAEAEIKKLYGNNIGTTSAQFILKTVKEFRSGNAGFIMSIAFVALLVGTVGIITTLYTSVNERTREIGTLRPLAL